MSMLCPECTRELTMMVENIYHQSHPTQRLEMTAYLCQACQAIHLFDDDKIVVRLTEKGRRFLQDLNNKNWKM